MLVRQGSLTSTYMDSKITLLEASMTTSKRDDGTEFYHFTDKAPKELVDLFLAHYSIRDLDYQIFSKAIDTLIEAWNNNEESPTLIRDYIEENYSEFASVYNNERLSYLNMWNDEEIANIFKEYSCASISEACAVWYDREVKTAIFLILDGYVLLNHPITA